MRGHAGAFGITVSAPSLASRTVNKSYTDATDSTGATGVSEARESLLHRGNTGINDAKMTRVLVTSIGLIACIGLLATCKDRPREQPAMAGSSAAIAPAAPDAAPSAAPGVDICGIGRSAIANATCPTPGVRDNLLRAKKSLDGIVDMIGQAGAVDPRKFQVMCAQLLLAIERDAAQVKCTLAIDASQRAAIAKLLDEWYAQRTPVVPTGDAAADAVISRIVAVRDAACECRDAACLDRVDRQLVTIGTMPATAPQAARDLGGKLLDDAARCATRVRTLTDPQR